MSSYEYHEFRAVDRPLTPDQQREVGALSSRAEVSSRHAAFTYNYSSFGRDPERLLTIFFDAMLYVANWSLALVFRLPAGYFDPARIEPYRVKLGRQLGYGPDVKQIDDNVLVSINLGELDLGWVQGEGTLEHMLPMREALMQDDDRPLYLFWLAAFTNHVFDLDDPEVAALLEPPVPPGMTELDHAHRAFARCFRISDGLLAAAAAQSEPRPRLRDRHFKNAVKSLSERKKTDCLLRVLRGDHVDVRRELHARARAAAGLSKRPSSSIGSASSRRSLAQMRAAASACTRKLRQRAHKERLDRIERDREDLWQEIERLLAKPHARFNDPVATIADLHELAVERGGLDAFRNRLAALRQYGASATFMKHLKDKGILSR